jgi:hypothetical protein
VSEWHRRAVGARRGQAAATVINKLQAGLLLLRHDEAVHHGYLTLGGGASVAALAAGVRDDTTTDR